MDEENKAKKPKAIFKDVNPKKDFRCFFDGKDYQMEKGKSLKVDERLLANLKTEKVI